MILAASGYHVSLSAVNMPFKKHILIQVEKPESWFRLFVLLIMTF